MKYCQLGTMSGEAIETVKEEMTPECRTCLQSLGSESYLYYIFQTWVPPWEGLENTIAEALERVANVQISDMDPHSKVICEVCCQRLHNACLFANLVQDSDNILRRRLLGEKQEDNTLRASADDDWPKPIQIDKIVPLDDQMEFAVKQEVLSDDENNYYGNEDVGNDVTDMEIKIEPELIQQPLPRIMNGHCEEWSPDEKTPEIPIVKGEDSVQDHNHVTVKEEPTSDNESAGTDLSLDCMLCTKVFNSVSGLKAHVIAQHSYKTVRRKTADESSPTKKAKHEYVCATCRRRFATSTDLMVHETCHNKSVCYGCNEKFDSFGLVMEHRLTCKVVNNKEQMRIKTLEDVQRPTRSVTNEEKDNEEVILQCALCEEKFTDDYYMNIHLEIHHPVRRRTTLSEEEMEVEALESLFTERA